MVGILPFQRRDVFSSQGMASVGLLAAQKRGGGFFYPPQRNDEQELAVASPSPLLVDEKTKKRAQILAAVSNLLSTSLNKAKDWKNSKQEEFAQTVQRAKLRLKFLAADALRAKAANDIEAAKRIAAQVRALISELKDAIQGMSEADAAIRATTSIATTLGVDAGSEGATAEAAATSVAVGAASVEADAASIAVPTSAAEAQTLLPESVPISGDEPGQAQDPDPDPANIAHTQPKNLSAEDRDPAKQPSPASGEAANRVQELARMEKELGQIRAWVRMISSFISQVRDRDRKNESAREAQQEERDVNDALGELDRAFSQFKSGLSASLTVAATGGGSLASLSALEGGGLGQTVSLSV